MALIPGFFPPIRARLGHAQAMKSNAGVIKQLEMAAKNYHHKMKEAGEAAGAFYMTVDALANSAMDSSPGMAKVGHGFRAISSTARTLHEMQNECVLLGVVCPRPRRPAILAHMLCVARPGTARAGSPGPKPLHPTPRSSPGGRAQPRDVSRGARCTRAQVPSIAGRVCDTSARVFVPVGPAESQPDAARVHQNGAAVHG